MRGPEKSGDRTQAPTHLPFLSLHAQRLGSAAFMIIAAKMQHAMDQQRHEFFFQRPAFRLRLTLSGRHGNDDLAQVGGSLIEAVRRSRLPKGEGQDVGAAILAPEAAIELPHPAITDEREIHVRRRFPREREDGPRQSQDSPGLDPERPDMDLERNGH